MLLLKRLALLAAFPVEGNQHLPCLDAEKRGPFARGQQLLQRCLLVLQAQQVHQRVPVVSRSIRGLRVGNRFPTIEEIHEGPNGGRVAFGRVLTQKFLVLRDNGLLVFRRIAEAFLAENPAEGIHLSAHGPRQHETQAQHNSAHIKSP